MNSASAPPLAEMLSPLETMTGIENIQTDVPLKELGIDSIDVLEWIFMLEDRLEIDADEMMGDFGEVKSFGDLTLQVLYDALVAVAQTEHPTETA